MSSSSNRIKKSKAGEENTVTCVKQIYLGWTVLRCISEKMTFRQRTQGNERMSYTNIWEGSSPGGKDSACKADWYGWRREREEDKNGMGKISGAIQITESCR